ncbi:MAG: inositol monophosphatase family protein [Pseudomonadota bacterium]
MATLSTPADPLDPTDGDVGSLDDVALLERLCDAARPIALRYFRGDLGVENKRAEEGGFDPVTLADRAIEARLRDLLKLGRPEDGVLGEEFGRVDGPSGRLWVLDPIDGTRNFMSGLLNWGVLIALHDGAQPILGALDQPYTAERFLGDMRPGAGAARLTRGDHRAPLRTRPCPALEHATLCTTDPNLFSDGPQRAAFDRVAARARLTRLGTDCYGYAMVAAGQVDLVVEAGLSAYDIQALIPLVRAAGGVVTNWRGGDPSWGGDVLAAGDATLHAAAMAVLNDA